jgi:hypothetical protein
MPTPSFPTGFKPVIQGYSIGAPGGVAMTEVGGGLPRVGMEWDRGYQPFQVTLIIRSEAKFSVWQLFFHHVIKKGAVQFTMPLNSGFGLADHLCIMVPGSYSAAPAAGVKLWSVSFTVLAENAAYAMTSDEAADTLALWEAAGDDLDPLLARLAQFATVDTLVLQP